MVGAFLAFNLLEAAYKVMQTFIKGSSCCAWSSSASIHPASDFQEHEPPAKAAHIIPQAVAEAEEGMTAGIEARLDVLEGPHREEPAKLSGLPEFDVAVRSKLLIGPDSYRMRDLPR